MTETNNTNELRLMTWNVWFNERAQKIRMQSILDTIESYEPEIIGLQELTKEGIKSLEDPEQILSEYHKIESDVSLLQGYWEGLYTRLEPGPSSGRTEYEWTHMGRGLTVLHYPALDLVVGTTHLESMDRAKFRQAQAKEAFERLDSIGTRNAALMGDMNLYHEESLEPLPPGWMDSWDVLHPHEKGWTRDSQRNKMLENPTQERLDRIFIRTKDYQLSKIHLLGTSPCTLPPEDTADIITTTNERPIFPSDHFGLLLILKPR